MDLLEKVRGRRQGVLEVVKARRSSRGRMVHELKFKADGGLNGWVTTSAPGSSLLWQNRRQFAQSCSGWRPRQVGDGGYRWCTMTTPSEYPSLCTRFDSLRFGFAYAGIAFYLR